MCKRGIHKMIRVKIPADLSCTSKDRFRKMPIDACIAPIVDVLQKGGIDMRGSCCGHGIGVGDIHLQDGRLLLILTEKMGDEFRVKGRLSFMAKLNETTNGG